MNGVDASGGNGARAGGVHQVDVGTQLGDDLVGHLR